MESKEEYFFSKKIKKLETDLILLKTEIGFWQNVITNFEKTIKKPENGNYEFVLNYVNYKNPNLMIAKCNVEVSLKEYQIKDLKRLLKLVK